MPVGAMQPRSSASHASLVAPSGIGPWSGERSAMASHLPCLARPSIHGVVQPARMARAGRRSARHRGRTSPSQRASVAVRPDQCIGKVRPGRAPARRSMSPDPCAYSTAFSGSSCWTHQSGRTCADLGGHCRFADVELVTQEVAEQPVIPIRRHDGRRVGPRTGCRARSCRSRASDPVVSSATSQSGPLMTSSTDDRSSQRLRLGVERFEQLRPHVVGDGRRSVPRTSSSGRIPCRDDSERAQPEVGRRGPALRTGQHIRRIVGET